MKTTIKQRFRSSYQSILDYFTWLFKKEDENSLYEIEEDVVEEELIAVVSSDSKEKIIKPSWYQPNLAAFGTPISLATKKLTKKQSLVLDLIPTGEWVSSTAIGNEYCKIAYAGDDKGGGSQYASKTLNELWELGRIQKNEKKQYRKL
jgi:hypothetical protein